jgi:hypothetical protein
MSALLRVLSKDSVGTLRSQLFDLSFIAHTDITIREADKQEPGEDGTLDQTVEFDKFEENKLIITKKDGSEVTIDTIETPAEFEVRDSEGEIIMTTDSLFELEKALMIAHLENDFDREAAMKELKK